MEGKGGSDLSNRREAVVGDGEGVGGGDGVAEGEGGWRGAVDGEGQGVERAR